MALGRGLGALLPAQDAGEKQVQQALKEKNNLNDADLKNLALEVDLSLIDPNPFQPRTEFSEEALDELKRSIQEHGIIQPLTVRKKAGGRFELIAGERRMRASKLAGLKKVTVYLLDVKTDAEMLELAIIENIQRKDLNAIEVANGYKRLMEECKLTQEEVAIRVGKDRTTVTNFLRLLKLPDYVQSGIVRNEVSMGHARALVTIDDSGFLKEIYDRIVKDGLSVREVEKAVKAGPKKKSDKDPSPQRKVAPAVADVEQRLRTAFSTKVLVKEKSKDQGTIHIEYYSLEELERILDLIESAAHK
ncbi:MAG: ParB/RepB/Spo0J family partition protein [Bacteroidetes bacterium]|nr:ParB/RepB/Spo0J family partition protein [Bacteroidota bacterium]